MPEFIGDSSALLAILFQEPEKQAFENIVASDERCVLSAVNAHETNVLRVRHGLQAVARLWQLLTDSEIEIVPFDETLVHAAAATFLFELYQQILSPLESKKTMRRKIR